MTKDFFVEILNQETSKPPFLCVEMSGNHMGSLEKALKFVNEAKYYGADILKVQVYKPDTITIEISTPDFLIPSDNDWSRYGTLYNLYDQAHTPWEWVEEIFKFCKKLSLPVFASPFDKTAVDFLETINCSCYKIASPEITDHPLISYCANTNKPIIFSTGLASMSDIKEAASLVSPEHDIGILKCTSAYPCPEKDVNLAALSVLREEFKCPIGVSDHTTGVWNCYASSALGAFLVEKHFRLDEDSSSVDTGFSLPLSRIPEIKSGMNGVFYCLGAPNLDIPEIARPSLSGRRSLYAIQDILPGERFTDKNIKSIRPSFGLHPRHLDELLLYGKSNRFIQKGDRLIDADLDGLHSS